MSDRANRAATILAALVQAAPRLASVEAEPQRFVDLAFDLAERIERYPQVPPPPSVGRGDYRGEGKKTSTLTSKDVTGVGGSKGGGGSQRFKPPTVDEVSGYMAEYRRDHNLPMFSPPNVAREFVDYYTACGWSVGRKKMKDWRAAVRNWLRRMDDFPGNKQHGEIQWPGRPLV